MDAVVNMYPNLVDQTDFRLSRINEIEGYFIAEIYKRRWMSKRFLLFNFFYYFDKSLIVLSKASGDITVASFASVNGAPVGLASANFSLAFSLTTGIIKKLLKATKNKKKKHNRIVMLARNKLNSIENTISKLLIDNGLSHEDFTTIINEEINYYEPKQIIRMMRSQRSNIERNELIEYGKRIRTDEIIRQNEIIDYAIILFKV